MPKNVVRGLLLLALLFSAGCNGKGGGSAATDTPDCDAPATVGPAPGCGLVCRARLPIERTESGPVTTVWIDDRPTRLLVDTGSNVTALRPEALAGFGLPPPTMLPGHMVGIGGLQARAKVVLPRLALGRIALTNVTVGVIEIGAGSKAHLADGVLGNDLMSRYQVDLDLPHDRVTLFAGRACPGPLPGWAAEDGAFPMDPRLRRVRFIGVPAQLSGHPIAVMLDSGAQGTLVNATTALALGVPATELADDLGSTLYGAGPNSLAGNLHRFDSLQVGGQTIPDWETAVARLPAGLPDVILGYDYLSTHKVFVSNATGQVRFVHTW